MVNWERIYLHAEYPIRVSIPEDVIDTARELQQQLEEQTPEGWSSWYEYPLPVENGDPDTNRLIHQPAVRVTSDEIQIGVQGHEGWEPASIHDRQADILFDRMFLYHVDDGRTFYDEAPEPHTIVLEEDEQAFQQQLDEHKSD